MLFAGLCKMVGRTQKEQQKNMSNDGILLLFVPYSGIYIYINLCDRTLSLYWADYSHNNGTNNEIPVTITVLLLTIITEPIITGDQEGFYVWRLWTLSLRFRIKSQNRKFFCTISIAGTRYIIDFICDEETRVTRVLFVWHECYWNGCFQINNRQNNILWCLNHNSHRER